MSILTANKTLLPKPNFQSSNKSYHQEWQESEIPEDLIQANLNSFQTQDQGIGLIATEEKIPRLNSGRVTASFLKKTQFLDDGGWYVVGYDLNTGQASDRAIIKPNSPRYDEDGDPIKYETTWGLPANVYVAAIPIPRANLIIQQDAPELWEKWEAFKASYTGHQTFAIWAFALLYPLPTGLTEGPKKALSVIGQNHLCIGISGIWNWTDSNAERFFDKRGYLKKKKLLSPSLKPLTEIKREFFIAFDEDQKPSTRENVEKAQTCLAKVLSRAGCHATILYWHPKKGKGIDDGIHLNGSAWFQNIYDLRLSLSAWLYYKDLLTHVDETFEKAFLNQHDVDTEAQVVGLQAPKAVGKTEALAQHCLNNQSQGIATLILTHRKQLAIELAERFGLDTAYDFRDSEQQGVLGITICTDSIHVSSHAKFNPEKWGEFDLILDEVEQVIAHTLISHGTEVAKHREQVLRNFTTLVKDARKIYLSDADLSNRSINYIQSLRGVCRQKIIQNTIQKAFERDLINYSSQEAVLQALAQAAQAGQKLLVPVDAQRADSTWGTINLESILQLIAPDANILRIDAETIGDKNHPAYHALNDINRLLQQYDIVIYSPTLSTGVSIDLPNYFNAIYSINQGMQSADVTRQFLARLRDTIPIHAFFNKRGINSIGGGETEPHAVLASQCAQTKQNLDNLKKLEFEGINTQSYAQHRNTYCAFVAHHNLGMSAYREIVLEGLRREGYRISHAPDLDEETKQTIQQEMTKTSERNYQQLIQNIIQTESPDEKTLAALENQQEFTEQERHQLKKGKLEQKYGVEVDEDLIQNDDNGLYQKLCLLFWLTVGHHLLPQRDKEKADQYVRERGKEVCEWDFNRTQYQAKIQILETLRIPDLMEMEGDITNETLQWWQDHLDGLLNRTNLKTVCQQFLGITISEKESTVRTAGKFLKKVGKKLVCNRRLGHKGNRQKVFRIGCCTQHQDDIFAYWLQQLEGNAIH